MNDELTALLAAGATIRAGSVLDGRIAVEVSSETRMGFACGDSYEAALRGAVAAYLDCRPVITPESATKAPHT